MNASLLISDQFIRFYLVCIHVLAACVALGTIVFSYLNLIFNGFISRRTIKLEHLVIIGCFLILFLTGGFIIYIDVGIITSFQELFQYSKLTVKLLVVSVILLNGIFIRFFVFKKVLTQNKFSNNTILLICLGSGISLSSWISAILVGKAKILVGLITLPEFISLYLIVLLLGIIGGIVASRFINLDGKIID